MSCLVVFWETRNVGNSLLHTVLLLRSLFGWINHVRVFRMGPASRLSHLHREAHPSAGLSAFFFLIPRFNSTRRVLFMPYGGHAAEFTGTSLGVSSLLFGQWCQDLMYPYGYLRLFSIIIFPEDSNLASFCTVHWNVFI